MCKFYELYFSPTGGTLASVKILGPEIFGILGMEPVPVNLRTLVRDGGELPAFSAEDICMVSVPSFAGRVPLPAVNLLQKLEGNGARAVLHVVYGNRAIDDTLLELRDVMEAAGFVCAAAVESVAEHSIFRQFGAGRPDAADKEELKAFACKIARILREELSGQLQVPGNVPYRERKPGSMIPVGGDACTGCGVCAEECPVYAIPSDNLKDVNRDLCFGCMRCVSVCPAAARAIPAEICEKVLPVMEKNCSGRKENRLYTDRKQAF